MKKIGALHELLFIFNCGEKKMNVQIQKIIFFVTMFILEVGSV